MENKNPLSSVVDDNFKTWQYVWHSVRCVNQLWQTPFTQFLY